MSNPRTFYRCVFTYPLVDEDFKSKAALGETMRPPYTEKRRQHFAGVSVYSDREVARAQALRLMPPRPYLAVLQVTPNAAVTSEQTGKRPEHYTLWAIPKALKGCVVSVVEIATGSTLGAVFSTSE